MWRALAFAAIVGGYAEARASEPYLSPSVWHQEGANPGLRLGFAASAADFDADGYADLAVGSIGEAFMFRGSATGLSLVPDWVGASGLPPGEFGLALDGAGDANGDGVADLLVSSPETSNPEQDEGAVLLWLGGAGGLGAQPDWSLEGDEDTLFFGFDLAWAGDVDGDGLDDALLGSTGRATRLYRGDPTGLEASPSWTEVAELGDMSGTSLSSAGDANGDGYADILVGAPLVDAWTGETRLYFGSPGGPGATPDWIAVGAENNAHFGEQVASSGDLDGDGYGDIAIGSATPAFAVPHVAPRAAVFFGTPTGPEAAPAWDFAGAFDTEFGSAFAAPGDMDGDGLGELVVGAPGKTTGLYGGRGFLFPGTPGGLDTAAVWTEAGQAEELYAAALTAGDFDGDGYVDLAVGTADFGGFFDGRGAVDVYRGQCVSHDGPDTDADGISDRCDRCAGGDDRADLDRDAVPDACDDCPGDADPDQLDDDADGIGDACEPEPQDSGLEAPDPGEAPDAPPGDDATAPAEVPSPTGGCGCSAASPGGSGGWLPSVVIAAVTGAGQRMRRRGATTPPRPRLA
jgi:hypothetical protein